MLPLYDVVLDECRTSMTCREKLSYAFAESDSYMYAIKTHFLRSKTTANDTKYL